MKKFISLLAVLVLLWVNLSVAFADGIDLSILTNEEVTQLIVDLKDEIVKRGIKVSATLPVGKYVGGKEIPIGSYVIAYETGDYGDAFPYGYISIAAPDDDLKNAKPSILNTYISTNEKGELKIEINEGDILILEIPVTISPFRLFF